MLIGAIVTLPFGSHPRRRSTSATITAFSRGPGRIVAKETVGNLLQVLESRSDVKPVEHRCRANLGVGENALESGTTALSHCRRDSARNPRLAYFRR
jgi:hypothetical protein